MKERIDNICFLITLALIGVSPYLWHFLDVRVLDRFLDILFITFIGCVTVGRLPSFNKNIFYFLLFSFLYLTFTFFLSMYEVNLYVSIYEIKSLLFFLVYIYSSNNKPAELKVKYFHYFIYVILLSSFTFFVLKPGLRLNLINESNYFLLFYSVVFFTFVDNLYVNNKIILIDKLHWFLVFLTTLLVVILSQSRTGTIIFLACFLFFLFKNRMLVQLYFYFLLSSLFILLAAIFLSDLPIFQRFYQLNNYQEVDRFIFFDGLLSTLDERNVFELFIPSAFWGFNQNSLYGMDWWVYHWAKINDLDEQSIGLAPLHFHAAFLRITYGHGLFGLILYFYFIYRVFKKNVFFAVGIILGSLSMSVPYLSLMLPTAYLAMRYRIENSNSK